MIMIADVAIRRITFVAAVLLGAAVFGGTVKVPLKTGWRFVKPSEIKREKMMHAIYVQQLHAHDGE